MEIFYSSKDYCSTAQKANVASSYTSVYNVCVCSLFWYFLIFVSFGTKMIVKRCYWECSFSV